MSNAAKYKKAYRFGVNAECVAAWYLRLKCYRILALRFKNGGGEIDIIASRGSTLVAVEVKARRTASGCTDTVMPWKQQKIARAVEGYMAGLAPGRIHAIRFDVIWITPRRLPTHIKDAWRM